MNTAHKVSLVKYCLCFFPNIQLVKHIIAISDENKHTSTSHANNLTLQHIVNYISQHETTDIHIQTLKQIADRRWYVHGNKLALPTTKKLHDIVFSMYNHYCKQHLNTFMKYLYEKINNITQLIRYCEDNGLFNHLLIGLCAYMSDDCKYYRRGISKQTLLNKYAKQCGEINTIDNITLVDNICFQPFVATLYLTNSVLLPISNNMFMCDDYLITSIDYNQINNWKLAKKIGNVLSIDVNTFDQLTEINNTIYISCPWCEVAEDTQQSIDMINILLVHYLLGHVGDIYLLNNKVYSTCCLYHDESIEPSQLLVNNMSINDVNIYIDMLMLSGVEHKNVLLNRLQQLKTFL